jgi:hypothetical protein
MQLQGSALGSGLSGSIGAKGRAAPTRALVVTNAAQTKKMKAASKAKPAAR